MKSLCINLFISLFLGLTIFYFLLTRCACSDENINTNKENMSNLSPSLIGFNMGNGVVGDNWAQHRNEVLISQNNDGFFSELSNIEAGTVPLPEGKLNFFYNNKFDPKCCLKPQNYSSSTGCACISEEQMMFLNERGGNNNLD